MIALRGIVRQDEEKKWRWTGIWTFGSLPEDEEEALKAKNPSVRPFAYTWEQARNASDILVPTASLIDTTDEETPDKKEQESTEKSPAEEARKIADGEPMKVDGEVSEPLEDQVKDKKEDATKKLNEEESPGEEERKSADGKPMQVEREASEPQEEEVRDKTEEATKKQDDDESSNSKEMGASHKVSEAPPTSPGTKKEAITFATTLLGEPPFTEAATVHPEKCPPGGAWTGYFETATNRKDRSANQVRENFTLFFNATPPQNARVLFFDAGEDVDKDGKSELLRSGRIHVRGMGSNQYGTWELIGSLDISTGVLECQRMYVRKPEKSPSSSRKKVAIRGSPRVSIDAEGRARAQSTRKRQLSWRKRASLSEEDNDVHSRRASTSSMKKPRLSNFDKSSAAVVTAMMYSPPGMISSAESARRLPGPLPLEASKGLMTGAKKRAAQSNKSTSPANSSSVKLPTVGDPNEARWRAAHFLYYRRYDPSSEEAIGGGGSTGVSSNTASFVIYEGEMSQGNCMRDGRGICLYSNGTLYEGEWKRNKEHGKGTLMTADRKHVIYKGEWERGRMHGQGVYYYNHDDHFIPRRKDEPSEQQGSRYEGDFKENARHGVGRYVLPDGSVYEGDWRENLMSGRGTFKWIDGSTYVGSWKDGKRNGPGYLQTSDGFVYDGMWVQNAMEGRGIATYPSGQRYEGLWSNGRREGRGTIHFTNGAVYEGRFRDDCMEGQGTMKMTKNAVIPRPSSENDGDGQNTEDWMIPISFQSDISRIHEKAGFTVEGE